MFDFTKEERQKIALYMAEALAEMEHCSDPQEVISNLYCLIVEDSSEVKGKRVAEIVTQVIYEYNSVVESSGQDTVRSLNQFFDKKTENLDDRTKQAVIDNLITSIACINHENGELKFNPQEKTTLDGNGTIGDFYNKVTELCENADTDKILQSIKRIDYSNLDYVKSVIGADMYAAINGIIIYCMAKKGELANIPVNVSVSQCVLGSYVELKLVDSIGDAYIASKNEEWLKKEIAKIVLTILPVAIFIICVLAVLIALEAVIIPELTLTVSGVISALIIAAPFLWYMGIIAYDILLPMVESARNVIREMRIFTKTMEEQKAFDEYVGPVEKAKETKREYFAEAYDYEEEIAEI